MERIPEFKDYLIDEDGNIYNGNMEKLSPYWGTRDRCMYITLHQRGVRKLRRVNTLMQTTYFPREFQYKKGYTLIPANGDFRDCRLSNLTAVPNGDAIRLKKILLGETRNEDFYKSFMENPTIFKFHSLPIDVQHYIKERVDIEWEPKTLGYPMSSTRN